MVMRIKQWLRPPVFEDEGKTRQAKILNTILLTLLVILIVPMVIVSPTTANPSQFLLLMGSVELASLIPLILMRTGRVQVASWLFVSVIWGVAIGTSYLIVTGVSGNAYTFSIAIVLMAGYLLGWRVGLVFAVLTILVGGGLVYIEAVLGTLPPSIETDAPFGGWVVRVMILAVTIALLYLTTTSFDDFIARIRRNERRLAESNQALQRATTALEQRTRGLELVTLISESLGKTLKQETLLLEVVTQIKKNFDYDYVGIYLVDKTQQKLTLAEEAGFAAGQGSNTLLNTPPNLAVQAAQKGTTIAGGVHHREANSTKSDPRRPDTYAEMAAPIISEGQVAGVLIVSDSKRPELDENDANLLRPLANQVAIGLGNARLFAEVETTLAEAHLAQQRYIEQGWTKQTNLAESNHYLYQRADGPTLSPAAMLAAKKQALETEAATVTHIDQNGAAEDAAHPVLVSPVILGDKKIGTLQLHRADQTEKEKEHFWTDQEIAVVEAVLDQFTQTAENMRLFDETRQRASREQAIREITERMQSAADMGSLMKVTTDALGTYFSVDYATVELGITIESNDQTE